MTNSDSQRRLPLTLQGARDPLPTLYRTPVASAQIKQKEHPEPVRVLFLVCSGPTPDIAGLLRDVAVPHYNLAVRHFGQLVVVGHDDERLAQLLAQQKEDLVQLLRILGV